MGGAGVEAPLVSLVVAGAIAEEGVRFWLVEVESRCGQCRCHEQSRLLRLCDVGLAASWLSAVLGPMAELAAVAAGVVSCRLVPAGDAALGASAGITLGTSSRPGLGVSACLARLATLAASCRGRRLPLPLVTLAGKPLLPSKKELPASGDGP